MYFYSMKRVKNQQNMFPYIKLFCISLMLLPILGLKPQYYILQYYRVFFQAPKITATMKPCNSSNVNNSSKESFIQSSFKTMKFLFQFPPLKTALISRIYYVYQIIYLCAVIRMLFYDNHLKLNQPSAITIIVS